MKKFWNNNVNGILGTIAFHLALAILFLLLRMSSVKSGMESVIYVDFEEQPEQDALPGEDQEQRLKAEVDQRMDRLLAEKMKNIPVNVAASEDEKISTEKYVEQLKEQLSEDRPDEWYRNQERLRELTEAQERADLYAAPEDQDSGKVNEAYKGPTTITYSLEGRYYLHLPIPVYRCEGEGEVTVDIAVDQRGRVVQVQVPETGDDFNSICLANAARRAALNTRFNADYNAPFRQKGTITYHFLPQD